MVKNYDIACYCQNETTDYEAFIYSPEKKVFAHTEVVVRTLCCDVDTKASEIQYGDLRCIAMQSSGCGCSQWSRVAREGCGGGSGRRIGSCTASLDRNAAKSRRCKAKPGKHARENIQYQQSNPNHSKSIPIQIKQTVQSIDPSPISALFKILFQVIPHQLNKTTKANQDDRLVTPSPQGIVWYQEKPQATLPNNTRAMVVEKKTRILFR